MVFSGAALPAPYSILEVGPLGPAGGAAEGPELGYGAPGAKPSSTASNSPFCEKALSASAPHESIILGHFVESGQTQAPRSSTRHELRIYIAFGGPRGPPGKVPVGTGGPPVPAGTYPGEHPRLPKALQTRRL